MSKILRFPQGFLWGTSTSAYQVEGGIENCDWSKIYPAGRACDHYNLYKEDFDLLKKLNQKAFRLSIEWSRIEPKEGEFCEKELEHYFKVLFALRLQGTKTMVSLHHFTTPWWMAEKGGWANREIIFYFTRFAEKVFDEYRELVDFWATINESLNYALIGYLEGRWVPKKKNPILFLKVIKNQIAVHKKIYEIFHKKKPDAKIGNVESYCFFEPAKKNSFLDKLSAKTLHFFWNEYFLNKIKRHLDFIGLNYYFRQRIKFPFFKRNENKTVSDIGWEIYPVGIYWVLKWLKKYNLPIFVTENGLADARDRLRRNFIKDHLYWINRAISEDVDVQGYFHWSLMDNFEWEKGFGPRFGLIEIDYQTLERKIRPSAYYFAEICKNNQLIITSENLYSFT